MIDRCVRAYPAWVVAVALTCGGIAAVPDASAQTGERPVRIGRIVPNADSMALPSSAALAEGMREHGHVEGRHFVWEIRLTGGRPERIAECASELVGKRVDLFVAAVCGAPLDTVRAATRSIPIVVASCDDDMVELGIIQSMNRPGGNVTGLSKLTPELAPKRLQLLKQVVPGATRIAVLWNPAYSAFKADWRELRVAAVTLGVTLVPVEFRRPDELEPAFATIARERVDALITFSDVLTYSYAPRVAALTSAQRLPAMFAFRELPDAGGLMSYGPSIAGLWRRAASFIDRIIKGAKPGDLPIEQPIRLELVINRKTANTLGLKTPQAVLLQADDVID